MRCLLKFFLIVIFLLSDLFHSNALSQETYPNRPITMIVPWSAGMGDTTTRGICRVAEKILGQPIVVENKPGATGTIGTNYVLKSAPDGYTLGLFISTTMIVAPHMRELPFNPLTDVTDICSLYRYNYGLCVRADAFWSTYEDIIEYAKKNPGKFTYSTAGIGTTQHITMERIAMKEGIKWTHVPFKSGGEATTACVGGHTGAVIAGSADVLPQLQAGKLKMLLVFDDKRWPAFLNVPTILEKGYGFYTLGFTSFGGPKRLPEAIRQKLEDAFKEALRDPSVVELGKMYGVEVNFMSGKDYSALWRSKYDEMGEVIKALGLAAK